MGGGDLNLKKSWHPNTMKNQERVWKAEQAKDQEDRKLHDLRKEIQEERNREELKRIGQNSGVLTGGEGDKKLEWMYQNSTELINRDEYLLGRSIDKSFESLQAEEQRKQQDQVGIKKPINHVEHECVPFSMRAYRDMQCTEQVDLQRKVMEDPLMLIKQREMDSRRKLLENPVKLKELHSMLKKGEQVKAKTRNHKKSKKSKKIKKSKKKRRHSSESDSDSSSESADENDLDRQLARSCGKLANMLPGQLNFSKLLTAKYKAISKELDKAAAAKAKVVKKSRKSREKSHRSRECSADSKRASRSRSDARRSKKRAIQHSQSPAPHANKRGRDRSSSPAPRPKIRARSRSPAPGPRSKNRVRSHSPTPEPPRSKGRARSQTRSPAPRTKGRNRSRTRSPAPRTKGRPRSRTRSPAPRSKASARSRTRSPAPRTKGRHHSRSRSPAPSSKASARSYSRKRSHSPVPLQRRVSKHSHTPASTPPRAQSPAHSKAKGDNNVTSSKAKPINARNKLSEVEKEARRREMMENAAWREAERSEAVQKHRDAYAREEAERQTTEFDKNFINKEVSKALAKQTSVGSRLHANLNNIQRSAAAMDKNFARK